MTHRNACRLPAVVPSLAASRSAGGPTRTENRYPLPLDHGLDVRLLALLRRQHERGRQRHVHVRERRVRALHRPRPQPRDHRQLPALVRLQVGPLPHHLRRDLDRRIQMPDPLLRLVTHPPAVVAHVLGQPLRPAPRLRDHRPIRPRRRVHRRPAREARRDFDHRLVDQHRHRVQVAGMGFEAEPLGFERQRPAAGERVVEGGQPVRVEQLHRPRMILVLGTGPTPAPPDLRARPRQDLLVRRVLPADELFENPEQPFAFECRRRLAQRPPVRRPGRRRRRRGRRRNGYLAQRLPVRRRGRTRVGRDAPASCRVRPDDRGYRRVRPVSLQRPPRCAPPVRVGQQLVDVLRRVVDHLREDHRPRRRQRPSRPPQMQRRRVPVPDGLLACGGGVDRVERKRDFDEFLGSTGHRQRTLRVCAATGNWRSRRAP